MTSRGTILIVDDSPMNLDILVFALSNAGYKTCAVQSGAAALDTVQQTPPDLVLLDVSMPGMDGYEVCQRLKQIERLRDVPVIFISSLSDTLDKIRGFEVGAIDYLAKPLDFEEVVARASTHITLYRQQREIRQLLVERELAVAAERRQRQIVNALLAVATALSSTLDISELLDLILSQVSLVAEYDSCLFVLLEGEWGNVVSVRSQSGLTTGRVLLGRFLPVSYLRGMRHPEIVQDVQTFPQWNTLVELAGVRAALVVPILSQERVTGVLVLFRNTPDFYTPEMATVLQAFADQGAIALSNARLYEQSRHLAATQERERLARELHDSVTQTLYSASSIAQAIPRLLDRKPEKVRTYVDELNELMQGALAEMRALLVELRSDALTTTDISVLIDQLAQAFTGRTGTPVHFAGRTTSLVLPPETQIAVYRVAQEALRNIEHHANASQVTIQLSQTEADMTLVIKDDGRGFEFDRRAAGHFGVSIMQERAAGLNAGLTITTAPGQGTQIRLALPL